MRLEVSELSFAYAHHRVLQEISFSLTSGEVVFLLGANGVGKSTLLRCMLHHLRPSSGAVRLDDVPIQEMTPQALAQRIAYIPQKSSVEFEETVLQKVLMGRTAHLSLFAMPGKADEAIAREALHRLGIGTLADRIYGQTSGGEQQLALIARAMCQQSRLLLMDEPVAHLDYGNQHKVLEQIHALCRADGVGCLISSHDPQHAMIYADRVLALHQGELIADGPPTKVLTSELLRTLYAVEVQIVFAGGQQLIVPKS